MRTLYPSYKRREEEKTFDIIQQSETFEDKFFEDIKFQDINHDLVLKLKWEWEKCMYLGLSFFQRGIKTSRNRSKHNMSSTRTNSSSQPDM